MNVNQDITESKRARELLEDPDFQNVIAEAIAKANETGADRIIIVLDDGTAVQLDRCNHD